MNRRTFLASITAAIAAVSLPALSAPKQYQTGRLDSVRYIKGGGRRSGRTTRALQRCPQNAFYVCTSGAMLYTRNLARNLGRTDIKVVEAESFLVHHGGKGIDVRLIEIDHYVFESGNRNVLAEAAFIDFAKLRLSMRS